MLMSLTRTTYHESSYTLRKVGLPSAVLRVPTELTLDQQIHSGGMMAIVFQDELFLRNLDTSVSCPPYAIKTHSLKGKKNPTMLKSWPVGPREREEVCEPRKIYKPMLQRPKVSYVSKPLAATVRLSCQRVGKESLPLINRERGTMPQFASSWACQTCPAAI